MIHLDQNAGVPVSDSCMQVYQEFSIYNTMYGFSKEKIELREQMKQTLEQLKKRLGYDKIIFNSGATESIQFLFQQIPDIRVMEGQHVSVGDFQQDPDLQNEDNIALICYVSSSDSMIQTQQYEEAKSKFNHIIMDVSQAIDRVELPKVSCIFFSAHKIGAPFGTGFLACTNEFYDQYLVSPNLRKKKQRVENLDEFQWGGTFNIPGFMAAACAVQSIQLPNKTGMKDTFNYLKEILASFQQIQNIKPDIPEFKNLKDCPCAFSSLTFEIQKKYCPRSFQGMLEDNGVQIGFQTACQSGQTAILRMSWKKPIDTKDCAKVKKMIALTFEEMDKTLQTLSGGAHLNGPFLKEINQNKFWLVHHFVSSHDLEPMIDKKYEIMFQPDLLKAEQFISLIIPAHAKEHRIEETILKQKANDEDFDYEQAGIRIQNRRLSKFVFINKPDDFTFELNLANFETSKMKIFLSDQVFRCVDDNLIMKKQFPLSYESEVHEYTVTYKHYPETLMQEIEVIHHETATSETETKKKEPSEKKEESESSSAIEGGKKDPDFIRGKIKFMISLFNLRLLTAMGGNNLSIAILTNLDKLYRRGQKPSKFYKAHQCIVQDEQYIDFTNGLGYLLTSMNVMKQIGKQLIKPTLKFQSFIDQPFSSSSTDSDKLIIQQLNKTQIQDIIKLLEQTEARQIVIFLPSINQDTIEDEGGLYYYFKKNGFSYDIDFFEYYDVWDHTYKTNKSIVKFYKKLSEIPDHKKKKYDENDETSNELD